MKTIIHRSDTRGHVNHGWLDSHHTFSFAGYHNPERMNFGMLRVLNDDIVDGGKGFGNHPHDNMEIVSIPLSGSLEHTDSMGTTSVIKTNDVQIMSAGTGVSHSEYNHSATEKVNFLQIWIFPKKRNIAPHYDQKSFDPKARVNNIQTIVSPVHTEDSVWINQEAYLSLANLTSGFDTNYEINRTKNGIYVFVLKGEADIEGQILNHRDGGGFTEVDRLGIKAISDTELLFVEVPMSSR
ncbi:MAG: pirin family protein [Bacteroidota bacterium]